MKSPTKINTIMAFSQLSNAKKWIKSDPEQYVTEHKQKEG